MEEYIQALTERIEELRKQNGPLIKKRISVLERLLREAMEE